LFPLELVLLPTERVPLHIFEPRYKELVNECLRAGSEFGILLSDGDGQREVGTRAAVVEVLQVFEDGRLNVVVEGSERFRVARPTGGRSFATAEVEAVEDEPDAARAGEVDAAMQAFDGLVEAAEAEVARPEPAAEGLSWALAARVEFGLAPKQELLELRSERARLLRVTELLEHATRGLVLERSVRERASGNGKVSPQPRLPGPDSTA